MLVKTITFKDLDGNDVTETYCFDIDIADITEMQITGEGLTMDILLEVSKGENGALIMKTFKDILRFGVGKRHEDGRQFIKNQQITDEFFQTKAYKEFFVELITDGEKAAAAMVAIMPPAQEIEELAKKLQLQQAKQELKSPPAEVSPWIAEGREPTKAELMTMSKEQLQEVYARRTAPE